MANIVVTSGIPAEGFALLRGHMLHIPPTGCVYTDEELMQLLPMQMQWWQAPPCGEMSSAQAGS